MIDLKRNMNCSPNIELYTVCFYVQVQHDYNLPQSFIGPSLNWAVQFRHQGLLLEALGVYSSVKVLIAIYNNVNILVSHVSMFCGVVCRSNTIAFVSLCRAKTWTGLLVQTSRFILEGSPSLCGLKFWSWNTSILLQKILGSLIFNLSQSCILG